MISKQTTKNILSGRQWTLSHIKKNLQQTILSHLRKNIENVKMKIKLLITVCYKCVYCIYVYLNITKNLFCSFFPTFINNKSAADDFENILAKMRKISLNESLMLESVVNIVANGGIDHNGKFLLLSHLFAVVFWCSCIKMCLKVGK